MSYILKAFAVSISCLLTLSRGQQLAEELFFSVTYRDFLPSSCAVIFGNNNALAIEQRAAWGTTINVNQPNFCDGIDDSASWRAALENGTIAAHPDFEAGNQHSSSFLCSSDTTVAVFPIGSCNKILRSDFSIVSDVAEMQTNGLYKPAYCKTGETSTCGQTNAPSSNPAVATRVQSNKKYFDMWYRDDLKYNKRIGQRLKMKRNGTTSKYVFDSGRNNLDGDIDAPDFGDANLRFFGPIDRFKIGSKAIRASDFNDPLDAPAWPHSIPASNTGLQKGFWITTELHTFFQYKRSADMGFDFSGDDDFWAYVDGKLVMDIGGIHARVDSSIDLNSDLGGRLNISEFLGLVDGEIYTLDIFHAERQTVESNFAVTTSLFPACNVIQSGTDVFNFKTSVDQTEFDKLFFVTPGVKFNVNAQSFFLLQQGDLFASNFIYTASQQNLGRGFVANFLVRVNGPAEGFAFVGQRQGLNNYPISGGKNFNFRGLKNSFAVVFDLCINRDISSLCSQQDVRVHYPDSPDLPNNATTTTRRTYDRVLRNLTKNEFFPVEIVFYGGNPNFLEVYVNQSLYLRENNFIIGDILGGLGGHVGLTATSSSKSAEIEIKDWFLQTVDVDAPRSKLTFDIENITLQSVVANGIDVSEGYSFSTFDFCDNQLEVGSLGDLISAFYFVDTEVAPSSGRVLQDVPPQPAVIVDNNDGSYTLALTTTVVADFSLVFAFGEGCIINMTLSPPSLNPGTTGCFSVGPFLAASSVPVQLRPTASPIAAPTINDDNTLIVAIASSGGGLVCIGLIATVFFLTFKRSWDKSKKYVLEGNLYKMEAQTEFNGADVYTATGTQLLKTNEEILRLKAQGLNDPKTEEILKLQQENEEMKTLIRVSKQRASAQHNPVSNTLASRKNIAKGRMEF